MIVDGIKLPDQERPQADECDLEANERLLGARAYILFTVKNKDGDTTLNYDPSRLSTIQMSGFIDMALNTLRRLKRKIDDDNVFAKDEEQEEE